MNKKAFTLVELLGVVIILAIVMLIAIPNITGLIERTKKDGYISDSKKLIYLVKYEIKRGNVNKPASGDTVKVTLRDLSTSDLEKDKDGYVYDLDKSYVYITRENGKVVYYVQLVADKSKNASNYRGILLVNSNELDDSRKYDRYYENLNVVSEESPEQINANKRFEIAIAVNNVEASVKSLKIRYGRTANLEITPKPGYYLSNVTCTNDYTTDAQVGAGNIDMQVVTISNNSSNYPSTCTFTASKITYIATIESSGVSVDKDSIGLKYKGTASVEVTPNTGYYLDRFECDNGYTANAKTGVKATTKQTVVISNNGVRGSTVCQVIGYPAYPIVSGGSKIWTTGTRSFTVDDPVPSSLVSRYEYYISNSSEEPSSSVAATGSFTDRHITINQSGKYIFFRIIYAHGVTSSWSPAKNLYVDKEPIQPPTIIGGGTTLTLEKTFMVVSPASTSGVSVYEYYVSDSSIKPSGEVEPNATLLSPTMTVATKGTYIYFRVVSNADIVSEWTDAVDLYVDPNTYKIVYNLNGGTQGSGAVSQFNVETETFNLPVPSRTGYEFAGWYENSSFTGSPISQITVGTQGNKNLHARWLGNTYAVTLDKQNGSGGTDSVSAVYGSPMPSAIAPTRTGYTLNGFFSQNDGSGYQYYDGSMNSVTDWNVTDSSTIYADWTAHTYTVKYHANGGNGTMDDQVFTYDVTDNLHNTEFIRDGYSVYGWLTDPSGTEPEYVNMQPVVNLTAEDNGTVDLYAYWERTKYLILYTLNGGELSNPIDYFYEDTPTFTLPTPTKPGYTFIGWTGSNGSTPQKNVQITQGTTANKTYTANWLLTTTITFGTPTINDVVVTLPYTCNHNENLSVSSSNTDVATATINNSTKTVTVTAKSIGEAVITVSSTQNAAVTAGSSSKTIVVGSSASSNDTAFQSALTSWAKIGTATDAKWYGSTTDSNIYNADGTYTILESVNTNNYTGYYYVEADGTVPQYKNIIMEFDMTSTNSDDDMIGAMFKFNPTSTKNNYTGYLLLTVRSENSSGNKLANNGLWRGNNVQFSTSGVASLSGTGKSTQLQSNTSLVWTRKQWQHYRIEAIGKNIKIYKWQTNSTGSYPLTDTYKMIDYTDTSDKAVEYGTYGFWTYSQAYAQFRNFSTITSYDDNYVVTVH